MRVRARKLLDQGFVCGKTDVRMDVSGPMGFSLDRDDEVGGPGLDTGQHSDANTEFVCKVRCPHASPTTRFLTLSYAGCECGSCEVVCVRAAADLGQAVRPLEQTNAFLCPPSSATETSSAHA